MNNVNVRLEKNPMTLLAVWAVSAVLFWSTGERNKLQRLMEAKADGVPVMQTPGSAKHSLKQTVEDYLEETRVNKAKKPVYDLTGTVVFSSNGTPP